ncbi:hypothetical protein SRB5_31590 [Streptomyces sp. RB5]|uniref:Calcium-binding protein n=1 Tax=Streptomyces smaragdinus TaxID=2585196 RepID=A0A7K0CHQ0_9ACTN|nr:calcium-binding protein [Streptomyces smaragdinus]MQY13019.1 hypothetical protein [Streptomyces smaragdinus]
MRKTAIGAALSGALALSALGLSAAQADTGPERHVNTMPAQAKWDAAARNSVSALAADDTVVQSVVLNNGKDIPVGTTGVKTVPYTLTVADADGIVDARVNIWKGAAYEDPDQGFFQVDAANCVAVDVGHSKCTGSFDILTQDDLYYYLWNGLAGTWNVEVGVLDGAGNESWYEKFRTTKVLRTSKLTIDATPEPVVKGQTITLAGTLSRASWDDFKYHGLPDQSVRVETRKAPSTAYTSVKGIYSKTAGALRTTVTASVDAHYRFNFAGNPTTAVKITTGDYVGVK